MDKINDRDDKDPKDQPNSPPGAVGAKPSSKAAPRDGETLETRVARLGDELQAQRMAIQDIEVALVQRIADVDDDRRDAATRLHRTLQSRHEEIEERLRRQASLILILLIVALLVVGAGLTFAYYRFDSMRQSLAANVDDVKETLAALEIPETTQLDSQTRGKLDALSTDDQRLSSRLDQLSARVDSVEKSVDSVETTLTETKATLKRPSPPTAAPAVLGNASPEVEPSTEAAQGSQEVKPPAEDATAAPREETPPAPEPEATAVESGPIEQAPEAAKAPEMSAEQIDLAKTPFTLQLMGFYSSSALENFVREHESDLPREIYYQKTTYRGRPWYVLIHSLHDSRESAAAAESKLPEALRRSDIWIRRLDPDEDVRGYKGASDQ